MKWLARAGCFSCWMLAGAIVEQIAGLLLSVLVVEYVEQSLSWIYVPMLLLMFPVGALLGLVGAWVTRESRELHRACRVVGLVFGLIGITLAVVSTEKARAAYGTGMFSVLRDGLEALLFGMVAVIGILMMGIGGCGTAARRQSPSGE